jgi:hypothetical protein
MCKGEWPGNVAMCRKLILFYWPVLEGNIALITSRAVGCVVLLATYLLVLVG